MNRRIIRRLIAAGAGLAATAVLAAPAQASLGISSFSLTPSTTQAGGTTTSAGPDLRLQADFSSSDGDSPQNLRLSLPAGQLANPSVVPFCSSSDFAAANCPAESQIGSGFITGTAPAFGTTLSLPTSAYLVQPAGSEVADIGLIVTFFDYPVATQVGQVDIRTTPDVGLDIPLDGLPDTIEGVQVQIDGIDLTIAGAVDGHAFTRNPTSCSSATSRIVVQSYGDPGTSQTATSAFTPTGCSSLPFDPTVSGTVTKDASDSGIGMTATIGSTYEQADSRSIDLTFPQSASPNLGTLLADECTPSAGADPWSACPVVGTASVAVPLLSAPLHADIYLQKHPNALPSLEIVVPAPFGVTLTGTPVLSGNAVQALVSDIPDIPITDLTIDLPGGPNALFLGGVHLCSAPQSFGGTFDAWSGVTASSSSAATVSGCPSGSGSSATVASASTADASATVAPRRARRHAVAHGTGGLRARLADAITGRLLVGGLHGSHPQMVVAIGEGRRAAPIRSVSVRLPRPLAGRVADVRVSVDGRVDPSRIRAFLRTVSVGLSRRGRLVFVTLGLPGLSARTARSQLRGAGLWATVVRAGGREFSVRLSAAGR